MSDKLPQVYWPILSSLMDEKRMRDLDDFCNKVMRGQVEKNKTDPRLAAEETKWKTMDRFSKRELGDTKK